MNTCIVKPKTWLGKILRSIDYNSSDSFYYLALLSAPVLLTAYRYFTEAQNFICWFPSLAVPGPGEVYAYLMEYFSFFVLMLAVPFAIAKKYRKDKLLRSLMGFANLKKNILWTLLVIVLLIIPVAYNASSMPAVQGEYPLPRFLLQDQKLMPVYLLGLLFLYYVPWEFFFRGFLLFGLKEKYGTTAAILIQTISSCLVHIDKPAAEMVGSIPFGIIFGIIAIRTKNIWVVVLLHASLGIFTEIFATFHGI